MAKKTEEKKSESTESKQGRAVMITPKKGGATVARADYIRDRYYKDKVKRGDIRKELAENFGHEVPYQIVFAATREKTDPRLAPKKPKAEAA